jgi:hypothetical protein
MEKRKSLTLPGIELRPSTPQIYRLRYPDSYFLNTVLYIVTYLINALPSKGSVNNLNNRETVFYRVRAAAVAMHRRGKYASTTTEAVFSVGFVLLLYEKSELELGVTVTGVE